MNTFIGQLEEELWWHCVQEHAADNQRLAERWQTDDLAHLKERYTVLPMPDSLRPLLEKALIEWREREKAIGTRLQVTPEQFVDEFKKAREQFLKGNDEWSLFVNRTGRIAYGAVRNMSWVNLFGWVLPAADPHNEEQHRKTGRFITALFYTELLFKYGNSQEQGNLMRRIEARWQLANG